MRSRSLVAVILGMIGSLVLLNLRGALILNVSDVEKASSHLPVLFQLQHFPVTSQSKAPEDRRKVVLIHIGKTGGETVRHTLKITCGMRQNPQQQELCVQSFRNRTESILSRHTIGTLHCDLLLPASSINTTTTDSTVLDRATTLLFTVRNPVDRIVSWFYYMNPANCNPIQDYYSTACNTNRSIVARVEKKKKGSQWSAKFFGCFSSINDFAQALIPNANNNNHNACTSIAWRTLTGTASPTSGHAYYNYGYYWNRTMSTGFEPMNSKEVWVVRTEFLWQDLQRVEDMFDRSTTTKDHRWSIQRNVTHGSEGHTQRHDLTTISRQRLCCALGQELDIYRKILRQASNLDPKEKRTSFNSLNQQCTVDSCESR